MTDSGWEDQTMDYVEAMRIFSTRRRAKRYHFLNKPFIDLPSEIDARDTLYTFFAI